MRMGDVFLQASTALQMYRSLDCDVRKRGFATSHVASIATATDRVSHEAFSALARAGFGRALAEDQVHLLVPSSIGARRAGKGVRTSVWSAPLTAGSFLTCGSGVYLSSPEFTFLQMATRLDDVSLVMLGMELCGTYRLRSCGAVIDLPQVTTVERLRSYLSRMTGAPGARKAREALGYVANGSTRPADTAFCLMFCLPTRMGGYALPLPRLGTRGSRESLHAEESRLAWPRMVVSISEGDDARGVLERSPTGFTCSSMASDEVIREMARQLGLDMGIRIRAECRSFVAARRLLRSRVMFHGAPIERRNVMVG